MTGQGKISRSQLSWRCRRGMLELDLLLNNFVELEYNQLTQEEKTLFSSLLDYPDQVLLDLLLEKTASSNTMVANLVYRIRCACHGDEKIMINVLKR